MTEVGIDRERDRGRKRVTEREKREKRKRERKRERREGVKRERKRGGGGWVPNDKEIETDT